MGGEEENIVSALLPCGPGCESSDVATFPGSVLWAPLQDSQGHELSTIPTAVPLHSWLPNPSQILTHREQLNTWSGTGYLGSDYAARSSWHLTFLTHRMAPTLLVIGRTE